MNEALIKELIKYKLNAANLIVNSLPHNVTEEIRGLGRIIIEGINEGCKDINQQNITNSKKSKNLNNITIL
ncbi:MAG: hypothetical protein PHV12_08550 [Bacteroidales bacterium]|nr:hypothetical protein [Bacteroidales bacterium]